MVACDNVNVEVLASAFMKHKRDTCKQYYVVKYSQLESARLSRQCYDIFHPECGELKPDLEIKKKPTSERVSEWFRDTLKSPDRLGVDTGEWENTDFTVKRPTT